MHVLSVDLGTSNTVAVLAAHGRAPRVVEIDGSATMPSAVFAAEDGTLVVGREAERRARLDPTRFEPNPKRRVDEQSLLLGDRVVTVIDALAAILHRVAGETSRQLAGQRPDEVRLTHPAQWGPTRCNVLLAAAHKAQLGPNLLLVPEPVAAAAHFASFPGKGLAPGHALAVYDLGAGTFDCAVVGATQNGYSVLAEDGLADLGGLDVDQALAEHVGRQMSAKDPAAWQRLLRPDTTADRRAQRALREDVKAAKEALSRHPQTEVPLPEPFGDVLVTRTELESLIRPSLLRSVELLANTVHRCGFAPQRLAGIYLVGGSSRIPLVAALLGESLRVVPTSLDQPETAVALGAHHVSKEGIASRTQEFGGHIPNRPPMGRAPLPNNFPQGQHSPTGQPSGPVPQQQYPQHPAGFSAPQQGFPQSSTPARKPLQRNRKLLIGGAAALVLVLVVVGGFFLLRGGTTTVDAATCQDFHTSRDSAGFTDCLSQLAGNVPDNSQCAEGANGVGVALGGLGGNSVTCAPDDDPGKKILYNQSGTANYTPSVIDGVLNGGGDRVEAAWQGNGLSGRYVAGAGADNTTLLFTVNGRPILGAIVQNGKADANTLADYFEQHVMPGD